MVEFILSGRIANLILVLIALETAAGAFWFWRKGDVTSLLSFVANSLAGAALVLALRAALQQTGWLFVAIYLFGGLLAHAADVALRMFATRQAAGLSSSE
ncbi:hypothetical protein [Aestuariivirga sp.]|uniref:hypothetical protein n=1 Tax=Aestuariivirga sp. TaxID=2650926 RepID=UPI003BAD0D49